MALKTDLEQAVAKILRENWTDRAGTVVPDPEDLGLGNDAVKLQAAVLYADMSGSTNLVDNYTARFASEVYKCYLACAARIIKSEGGEITSYDGDRIMAVYLGDSKNTSAARTGLKIQYAVTHIINPAIRIQYPETTYSVNHTVGIDSSELYVSRVGVRNDNDLVWVGRAANYAAKLTECEAGYTFITQNVFDNLHESLKFGGNPKQSMWDLRSWNDMGGKTVYRSNWWWEP